MITKQPNGLYARISTIVDAPTHSDMSMQDVDDYVRKSNQFDFKGQTIVEWLKRYEVPFDEALKGITDLNMSLQEKEDWIKSVTNYTE